MKVSIILKAAEEFEFAEEFDNIWPDYVNMDDVLITYDLESTDDIDGEDYTYYVDHNNKEAEDDTIKHFITTCLNISEAEAVSEYIINDTEEKTIDENMTIYNFVKDISDLY